MLRLRDDAVSFIINSGIGENVRVNLKIIRRVRIQVSEYGFLYAISNVLVGKIVGNSRAIYGINNVVITCSAHTDKVAIGQHNADSIGPVQTDIVRGEARRIIRRFGFYPGTIAPDGIGIFGMINKRITVVLYGINGIVTGYFLAETGSCCAHCNIMVNAQGLSCDPLTIGLPSQPASSP